MAEVKRPWMVTLVEVVAIVSGIVGILAGIAVLVGRSDTETLIELVESTGLSSDQLLWLGIVAIVIGSIKVMLASALGRGSELVRAVFVVVATINLGIGVWGLFAHTGDEQLASAVSGTLALMVLWLLLGTQSQAYFDEVNKR